VDAKELEQYSTEYKKREKAEKDLRDAQCAIGSHALRKAIADTREVRVAREAYENECKLREEMESALQDAQGFQGSSRLRSVLNDVRGLQVDTKAYETDCKARERAEIALQDAHKAHDISRLQKAINNARGLPVGLEAYERDCASWEAYEQECKAREEVTGMLGEVATQLQAAYSTVGSEQMRIVFDLAKATNEKSTIKFLDPWELEHYLNECNKREKAEKELHDAQNISEARNYGR